MTFVQEITDWIVCRTPDVLKVFLVFLSLSRQIPVQNMTVIYDAYIRQHLNSSLIEYNVIRRHTVSGTSGIVK
jgi:hypothetical protein